MDLQRHIRAALGLMGDLALVSSDNGIVQGQPVDIDGYYLTNSEKTSQAMRPSQTLNLAIASL